jgi:dTMP kinase
MSLLISIEGIDGSGKTTLIRNLKKKTNFNLLINSWQDTNLGQKIWNLLNETRTKNNLPTSTWSYIFLFFATFEELNQQIIQPNLARKNIIIDRYIDSTFVYQGLAEGIEINTLQEIAQKTIGLPLPDITFLLDIDPFQAQTRLKKRKLETGKHTNWDNLNLDFHQKIRNYYLELKKYFPERIHVINASKSEDEITQEVSEIIQQVSFPQKDLPQAVRVIIRNKEGKLLLVKDKKWGWNLPGGKIEVSESVEAAARRETFEETNLVLEKYEKLGVKNFFYANLEKGNQVWKVHFYQANKYTGEIHNKEPEKINEIKFFAPDFSELGSEQHAWNFYWEGIKKITKTQNKKNTLIIIAGGSGAGKTTVEDLLAKDPNIIKAISTTTRSKRAGEIEDKDYYFVGSEEFQAKLKEGKFLEHVIYDGNYYGVEKKEIDKLETQKKNVVIIVDVEGFRQIKKYCLKKGYSTVSFWFQTESREKMVEHMKKRGTPEPEITRRLIINEQQKKAVSEFDFVLTIPENDLLTVVQEIKTHLCLS